MNISAEKRFLSLLLAIIMVFLLLPFSPMNPIEVHAATGIDIGVADLTVESSNVQNTASASSGAAGSLTVTASTAKDGCTTKVGSITVTIKNSSGSEAAVSFKYSKTGTGTVTFDPTASSDTAYSTTLAADKSITITVTSGSNGGNSVTLSISELSLTSTSQSFDATIDYDSSLGSVKAGGNAVSPNGVVEGISPATGVELVATPASGAIFLGWIDSKSGAVISKNTTHTFYPSKDASIIASFSRNDGTGTAKFGVGISAGSKSIKVGETTLLGFSIDVKQDVYSVGAITNIFYDLQEALNFADALSSDSFVVLMNSGTLLADEYTIPSGVTLLIPYDADNTYCKNDPCSANMPTSGEVIPSPYKTLILEDGVKISVENGGNIEVAAMHYASHGGKDYGGRPVNGYGHIIMNGSSSIVLNSGANLYAWGYITGSDDAQVIAEKGSTIHEKMQVSDYRGGNLTTDCTKDGHFPFSQYYIQNIEIKEVIKSGANLKCYATIYASAVLEEESVSFMGDGAMFTLGEGAQATKYYDASTDRLIVDVKGSFSFNSISLMGEDTSEFVLPLQQNLTINLESGAIATVDQDIMLQPGCEINIGEGAKLTIASGKSVYLMDKDQWGNFCSAAPRPIVQVTYVASRNGAPVLRTVSADAYLNINGTLIVEGQLYASAGHASIVSKGETGVIQFVSATNASSSINLCSTISDQDPAWSAIAMTPVFLTNTDGTTVDTTGTAAGTTYSYNTDCNMWVTHGADGHNYGEVKVAPTCYSKGSITKTCSACGDVVVEELDIVDHSYTGPAKDNGDGTHDYACVYGCGNYGNTCEHTPSEAVKQNETAATCTATGSYDSVVYCSDCGVELSRETITVSALGHNYDAVVTDPTCTEKGYTTHTCSRCSDSYIDSETNALGHDYDAVVTAPTCTEKGYTTHTCSACGNSYTDTEIDALDHNYDAVVTAPTCTEKGFTTHTCSRCGDSYIDSETDALGHSFEHGECVGGDVKLGDTNGDGDVTTSDVGILNAFVLGKISLSEEQLILADVNGDGKITTADVALLNAYALGKIQL